MLTYLLFSRITGLSCICFLAVCVCMCANARLKKNQNKQKTITHTHTLYDFPVDTMIFRLKLKSRGKISLPLTPFTSVLCMIFFFFLLHKLFCLLNFLKTLGLLLAWWHEEVWSDLFHSCSYWFFTFVEQTNKIHFARFSKITFPFWPKPGAFRVEKAFYVWFGFSAAQVHSFIVSVVSKLKDSKQNLPWPNSRRKVEYKPEGVSGFFSAKRLDLEHLFMYCVCRCRIAELDTFTGLSRRSEGYIYIFHWDLQG